MDLKFLGVGAAFNTIQDNNSAFIKDESSLILLDCGGTIFSRIQKLDLLKEVNKIYAFITHFHPDHIGSLGDLIFYTHYVKSFNISVYSPDKKIIELLRLQGLKEGIHYEFCYVSTNENDPIIISDNNIFFKAFAVKSKHDDNIDCYSYCLEEYEKIISENDTSYNLIDKVFYTGDTAELSKFIFNNINVLNKIYCDVSDKGGIHISLNKITAIIPEEIRNKFYLMHYSSENLIDQIKSNGFNIVERI